MITNNTINTNLYSFIQLSLHLIVNNNMFKLQE